MCVCKHHTSLELRLSCSDIHLFDHLFIQQMTPWSPLCPRHGAGLRQRAGKTDSTYRERTQGQRLAVSVRCLARAQPIVSAPSMALATFVTVAAWGRGACCKWRAGPAEGPSGRDQVLVPLIYQRPSPLAPFPWADCKLRSLLWALTQGEFTAAHEGSDLRAELVLQVGGAPVSMTPQHSGYWRQPAASRGGCLGETPWRHIRGAHESRPTAAESRQDGQGLGRPQGEGFPGPSSAPLSSGSTCGATRWGHSCL